MEILTLGQKIKKLRKEKKLTLKELAGERITAAQISFIELGKSNPSHDLLDYLASRLGQPIDYFIESEEEQARKYADYFLKIAEIYSLKEQYEEAKENVEQSLVFSLKYNLISYLGMAYLVKGDVFFNQRVFSKASKSYLQANQYFIKEDNIEKIVTTYIKLGKANIEQRNYLTAFDFLKMAEVYVEDHNISKPDLLVELYYNLVLSLRNTSNYKDLSAYIDICNKNLQKVENQTLYGDSLLSTSIAYKNSLDFTKALEYANKALEIFRSIDNSSFTAKAESNIAIIKKEMGDVEGSIGHLKKAIQINKQQKNVEMAKDYLNLAKCYMDIELYEMAENAIKEAQGIALDFRNVEIRGICYYYLFRVKCLMGNYQEAIEYIDEYLEWVEKQGDFISVAKAYIAKGNLYKQINKHQESLEYFSKGYDILTKKEILENR